MLSEHVIYMAKNTINLVFYLSMPIIVVATVVGLLIALVQTLIQLQEQTLGFAAKLTAVIAVFTVTGGWMSNQLLTFLRQALNRIGEM